MYSPLPQYVREQHRKYQMRKVRNAGTLLLLTATIVSAIVWVIA